jgi:hypothetical protein
MPSSSSRRAWFAPMGIALICAAGMVSALLGDGLWDVLSWFALALPILVCVFFWAKSR